MKKRILNNSTQNVEKPNTDRADRLAQSLRDNLKKRKLQARAQGRAPIKEIKEI